MKRTNAIRNLSLSLLLASSVFAAPVYAQISINVNIAPPSPQHEVMPAIAPGYAWAPGYWGWNGDRYIWVRGRSIVQREGYRWEPDRWEQRDQSYYRESGYWKRDDGYKPVKEKKQKKLKKVKDHHDNGEHKGNKHRD